jgi:outer membrane protein TolC
VPSPTALPIILLASILSLAVSPHAAGADESTPEVTITEAVLHTLNEHPAVRALKETAAESRGHARAARGQFDWTARVHTFAREDLDQLTQTERLTSLVPGTSIKRERREFIASASRKNRDGVTVQPFVRLSDTPDRVGAPTNVGRSEAGLEVFIPLLRGRGHYATVGERAARRSLEATELRVLHNISNRVLQTVIAHNNCLAARRSFELNEDILARAEALQNESQDRITAGMLEPAFIHQSEAKLAQNKAGLVAARNGVYSSRQALGAAMGLPPEKLVRAPHATGSFPEVASSKRLSDIPRERFLELAKDQRWDYQAVLTSTDAQDILLDGDLNGARPLVDLQLRGSWTGISEKTSFWSRQTDALGEGEGLNKGAFLTFQFPLGNDTVRGRVDSRRATVRRLKASAESLLLGLSSGTLAHAETLRNAAIRYELLQEAERDFQKAVTFEQGKYRSGNSSLNLVILLENQYTGARLAVVEAIRQYSNALAQLKFQTGTLLRLAGQDIVFRTDDLHRIPE